MPNLNDLVTEVRALFGRPAIDPIDPSAPKGTHVRRIAAYNALRDLAVPGRDKYCGKVNGALSGPCVLREGHPDALYDTTSTGHMDVEQRDRAERYLVHSEPDPARRA